MKNSESYHCYLAYGLKISSIIPLPELSQITGSPADLIVREKQLELPPLQPTSIYRQGREAYFGKKENSLYFHWQDVASFQAKGGSELNVMKAREDLDLQLLNLYLLSEPLGLILHQRGYFLLHGSAIVVSQGVIVFLGKPGAGKSTTAGAFAQNGYAVVADDLVALAVNPQQQTISVIPAFPQLKLWESAVTGLNYDRSLTKPLFSGSQKQAIKPVGNFPDKPNLPLSAIYVVESCPSDLDLKIEKLSPQQGIIDLTRFFSCPHQLLSGIDLSLHFRRCEQIVNQIPLCKLLIPRRFNILSTLVDKLTM